MFDVSRSKAFQKFLFERFGAKVVKFRRLKELKLLFLFIFLLFSNKNKAHPDEDAPLIISSDVLVPFEDNLTTLT